jgi:hypothetical protein
MLAFDKMVGVTLTRLTALARAALGAQFHPGLGGTGRATAVVTRDGLDACVR